MLSTEGTSVGLNAEQGWKITTVTGWAWVKGPHTAPKHHQMLPTELVHLGWKALSGGGHSECCRSQEPKAWQSEHCWRAWLVPCHCPHRPDLKGILNPLPNTTGMPREGPALLFHIWHSQVAPKPLRQVKRNSAFQT